MDDQLPRLDSTLDDLRASLRALEQRVAALENRTGPSTEAGAELPPEASPSGSDQAAPPGNRDWRDPIAILSLLGRLLIVLGGGFLLRAMTEGGTVPPAAGVGMGFAYGLVWLAMADRAAGRGQVPAAVFHAIAAALVTFPLVLEATLKFGVLPGMMSAGALTLLAGGLVAVAWRRRLQALAWIAVCAAIPVSVVLLARSGVVVPHALFLIALGVATLWMGYSLDWLGVRWPVALAADIVVFGVTMRAISPEPHETPGVALFVQMTLLGAYLISIAVRTLVRGRNVIPFEVVQTVAALAVGFGGAVAVTRTTGAGAGLLGAASVVFGLACYGVAFAFIDPGQHRGRNVYFYTTLGLVLVLAGGGLLLPTPPLGVTFGALAVVTCILWSRFGRLFLLLHGAAYILAAALVSEAVSYTWYAFGFNPTGPWHVPLGTFLWLLAASAAATWFASRTPEGDGSTMAAIPRLVLILMTVCAAGVVVVGYLAPLLAGGPEGTVNLGVLATVRTGVLAIAALAIAWVGRHARYREWGWLVYPLLVAIGIKMVAQDFMLSKPATMFVALALYGAALILAPRLRRRQA